MASGYSSAGLERSEECCLCLLFLFFPNHLTVIAGCGHFMSGESAPIEECNMPCTGKADPRFVARSL